MSLSGLGAGLEPPHLLWLLFPLHLLLPEGLLQVLVASRDPN